MQGVKFLKVYNAAEQLKFLQLASACKLFLRFVMFNVLAAKNNTMLVCSMLLMIIVNVFPNI